MRHHLPLLRLLPAATLAAALLAACGDKPVADRVVGSYDCSVSVFTRYYAGGSYRDTSYAAGSGSVTITKRDDNTVSVALASRQKGEAHFEQVALSAYDYMANLSGQGSAQMNDRNSPNAAELSGTFTYATKALAVTVYVKDYSSSKFGLTFTNTTY